MRAAVSIVCLHGHLVLGDKHRINYLAGNITEWRIHRAQANDPVLLLCHPPNNWLANSQSAYAPKWIWSGTSVVWNRIREKSHTLGVAEWPNSVPPHKTPNIEVKR